MTIRFYGIGGGTSDDPRMLIHHQRVVELARNGKSDQPHIALLPTAHRNGTSSRLPFRNFFRERFSDLDCKVSEILLGELPGTESVTTPTELQELLDDADAVFVLGGDTKYLLEQCQADPYLSMFRNAFESGLLFSGSSAGCVWLFDQFLSGCEQLYTPDNWKYQIMKGFGFLNGLIDVHHDEALRDGVSGPKSRKEYLQELAAHKPDLRCVAIDEFSAIEIVDDDVIVRSNEPKKGAYFLTSERRLLSSQPVASKLSRSKLFEFLNN